MSLAVFHYILWVEEPGAVTAGGGSMTSTMVFSWEGSGLIRNNFLQPLYMRLWRHHAWRELWLTGLLSPGWGDVCLGQDDPELQKRHWISCRDVGGARLQQNCEKWVTRRERELWEHVRICNSGAMEPLLHKNWYQMTQPYKSDTDHTMDMWLLLPN